MNQKTYHIFILGCQMNQSDAEKLERILEKTHFKAVSERQASIILVIACSVRQKPVDRIWGKLKVWSKINPKAKIYITGCLTKSDKAKLKPRVNGIFHIDDFRFLAQELEIKLDDRDYLERPALRKDKESALVSIMTGCNNFCSYCVVPYTRGRERSRSEKLILKEVKSLVGQGYKKITLLGQNVNSYKNPDVKSSKSKQSDFVNLLEKINKISGKFEIEFMTSHPKDMGDDLIKALATLEKLSSNVHLPVQSGDDQILKAMNRHYTVADYLRLVKKLRSSVENLSLTTDIIVGFPKETKAQFQNTVELVKKTGFDQAFVSQYSPRPNTKAWDLEDNISPKEKKQRWLLLDRLINQ